MPHATRSVTVKRPREEVYGFWRELSNLPRFMQHLEAVNVAAGGRSHWVARAPGGKNVEWDAEIVDERPNELLVWRSTADSEIRNTGSVQFRTAPADRGTEIRVDLDYEPPAGRLGAAVAKLFGEEPNQQLQDDLRRFKQVMETGEVVLSDGSLEGAGQGAKKQRVAQPAGAEVLR